MSTTWEVLRQLHLIVEAFVASEHQASDEYAAELRRSILEEFLPRVARMVQERVK